MKRWHRADGAILLGVALLAVVCALLWWQKRTPGTAAVITLPDGRVQTVALSQPQQFELQGDNRVTLTVEIDGGRIRVQDSNCPDHVCQRTGWLSGNGQCAVCVPARITIRVVGGEVDVDGVTA